MKAAAALAAALFLVLACGDSALSIYDAKAQYGSTLRFDEETLVCHRQMKRISIDCMQFYGMNNRYPDSIAELECIDPGVSQLVCPTCQLDYQYQYDPVDEVYIVACPLQQDPDHGYIENCVSSWPPDPPQWPGICHGNMMSLASACFMFHENFGRYPEDIDELVTHGLIPFHYKCPQCDEFYIYSTDPDGSTYSINCPVPMLPNHGSVIDGDFSWPPDTSGFCESCRSNMTCLGTGMSMFYGCFNRYPAYLREMGEEGIMGNWYIPCPTCGETYDYQPDSTGQTFILSCPLTGLQCHGSIVDGVVSWD